MATPRRFDRRAGAHRRLWGAVSRLRARRRAAPLLLGKGFEVGTPRCECCGRTFAPPREHGQRFTLSVPIAEPQTTSPNDTGSWLFLGERVMIAAVGRHTAALLEHSAAFVGDKVLVVMAHKRSCSRWPLMFCAACGDNLRARVKPENEPFYTWDWLADLRPRWRVTRWLHRLVRRV